MTEETAIPYAFRNPELLRTALTVPAPNRTEPDNQRLEFLGDAVLQLLVSETLFRRFPDANEGVLTDMRLHLVSGRALARRAETFCGGVRALLERRNPGIAFPQKAVVDAVEAIVGAAWEDGGRPAAEALCAELFTEADYAGVAHCTGSSDNPKGQLLHVAQVRFRTEPEYALISKTGPSHAPRFCCAVRLAGLEAMGEGPSRKRAEEAAARAWTATHLKDSEA